jgi:hypothetical protein
MGTHLWLHHWHKIAGAFQANKNISRDNCMSALKKEKEF